MQLKIRVGISPCITCIAEAVHTWSWKTVDDAAVHQGHFSTAVFRTCLLSILQLHNLHYYLKKGGKTQDFT